jgi:DNA-binding NtrC family response regulator
MNIMYTNFDFKGGLMTKPVHLTAEERDFFNIVHQAVLANPFSDQRAAADLKITGMFPNISRNKIIQKAAAEVGKKIAILEKTGRANLNKFSGQDRQILMAAFLFDIFHFFLERFDQLILDQINHSAKPLKVPFATEALSLFRKRGFDANASNHLFSLCFQLRRAYFFIDRGLVGRSPCMKKMREDLWNNVFTCDLDLYNQYLWNRMEDFSTVILGETGTGKGAAALAIGRSGYIPFDEKNRCFIESFTQSCVALNLSQFPESLIESELFGHKKGSFTGAVEDHKGIFNRCSKYGSIFLDEIGEVSIPIQIKLLKVLEERLYCPVGSHKEYRFEGRVIAATNRSIETISKQSLLRDDFFYRLCSDIIQVPPLHQRIKEDPEELDDLLKFTIERITGRASNELLEMTKKSISDQLGQNYPWPGNVRELGQCVRRILLKRSYKSIFEKKPDASPSELFKNIENGNINAKNLIQQYCRLLYDKLGTYGEVARRTGLDRRTVKKHIES